jgi:hypothetical protein
MIVLLAKGVNRGGTRRTFMWYLAGNVSSQLLEPNLLSASKKLQGEKAAKWKYDFCGLLFAF